MELRNLVDREIEEDERILWMDGPVPHYFNAHSISASLFAIPWTAFAIFWTFGAWGQAKNIEFALFGVPFILIGLGMLCTPLWVYRNSLKSVYVITDQRAIIFDGGITKTTIRSYPPDQLQEVYRKEKRRGTGDVLLSSRRWRDSDGDQRMQELGFMNIANAKEVEGLVKQLAQQDD